MTGKESIIHLEVIMIMDEYICSGYCRCTDGPRAVICEYEPGKGWNADCLWPVCPHNSSCLLAQEMDKLPKEE